MSDRRINFALVGCGSFGRKRAEALTRLSAKARLIGVFDIDRDKARAFAQEFATNCFDSLESISERDGVQAVILATPNNTHFELNRFFIKKNIHILCEKPLCTDMKEAQILISELESSQSRLKMGANLYHFPAIKKTSQMIKRGELGQLKSIKASIGHDGSRIKGLWYENDSISGGGCFLDNGIHMLGYLQDLLGPLSDSGDAEFRYMENGPEDYVLARYETEQGVPVEIEASWQKRDGYADLLIESEKGQLKVDALSDKLILENDGKREEIEVGYSAFSIEDELDYFIEAINNDGELHPDERDSYLTLKLILDTYGRKKS